MYSYTVGRQTITDPFFIPQKKKKKKKKKKLVWKFSPAILLLRN